MSRFFINRPVFAWVIAIVIMVAGALSILTLPILNVPEIAILTMEAIVKRPVVIESPAGDSIAIRPMMAIMALLASPDPAAREVKSTSCLLAAMLAVPALTDLRSGTTAKQA